MSLEVLAEWDFINGYYRHKFSAEQIAKMRSIISQREEVSPTIHQKTDYRSQTFLQQRYLLAECIKCR